MAILLGVALAITLASLLAAARAGATRYASPAGSSANNCQSAETACDLATAVEGAPANEPKANEEVIVEPGTYEVEKEIEPKVPLLVRGAPGVARPLIKSTTATIFFAKNLSLAHLELEELNRTGIEGLHLNGGTQEGLLIRGSTSGVPLCQCLEGTLRDSVVVALPESSTGAVGIIANGGTASETLRNDTIYSESEEDPAIQLSQQSKTEELTLNAYNTIAINVAGGHDVNASQLSTITMHNSDYASPTGAGMVIDTGGHVSSPPLFVNAAGGDFRELAGSPTIDAGLIEEANGPLDFEGNPRTQGASTDIGAFEFPAPPLARQSQPQGNTPPAPALPVPPSVGSPAQSHRSWREGGKLAHLARHQPPVGTTFSFTLSEPASVTLSFTQLAGGRRVHHVCVPASRGNQHKPACKRTLTRGVLTLPGHAGRDVVEFQGRTSSSTRLPIGVYTLSITATNATGQRSNRAQLSFTIVR